MDKPNRIIAFLSYPLLVLWPLIVVLFRRKDRFSLYHACQSLGLVAAAIVIPVMWLVVGWIFTFLSVEAPILYLIPIAFVLVMPVIRRRQRAVRYKDRWSWFTILVAALVAVALVYGSYLVLKWLAPLFLPLAGQLLLMSGFSLVMAAAIALVIAWLTGMINALRARSKPVPIFGRWGDRLFARLVS